MSEYSESAKAKATLEALAAEKAATMTSVVRDESNYASFPGFPYKIRARGEAIIVVVDLFKSGYECKTCKGTGKIAMKRVQMTGTKLGEAKLIDDYVTCSTCNGKTGTLVLPDEAKSLPCTGVIVSIGTGASHRDDLKLYDRVLFGPHSGRFIPISKAGALLKIMHEREATAVVEGGEDLAAFDFIDIDKEMQ
jgi:co-chaperonin GroES (HSP10)